MNAKKLPSGSWRVRVYWYTDEEGKKHYKSFTCADPSKKGKRMCEAEAAAWAMSKPNMGHKKKDVYQTSFSDALEKYIRDREGILSPSSIRKYRSMQTNHFAELRDMVLTDITEDDVQEMVNRMIKQDYSSKTISEVTSIVSTVLKANRINIFMNLVKKPKKKKKKQQYIPTDDDVKKILNHTKGTVMFIPIMLGAFCGLRRGEVAALQREDIKDGIIHVHLNMVDTPEHTWVIKEPKTAEGDRFVPIPAAVVDLLPTSGPITTLRPNMITSRFQHIVQQCGLDSGLTFHCLRHYTTSVKIHMGENDLVIRKEMGWSEKDYLQMKGIYGHTVSGHEYSEKSREFFDSMTRGMTQQEKSLE